MHDPNRIYHVGLAYILILCLRLLHTCYFLYLVFTSCNYREELPL